MSLSIGEALHRVAPQLAAAGVPGARAEARLLLAHAAGLTQETIVGHPERLLEQDAAHRLAALVERRVRREPLAQITGLREFWSLPFRVSADTLTPRPDSETLVEAVLAEVPDHTAPLRILDLGTGTGCLLLALLSEMPRAMGLGVDLSEAAIEVARRNAAELKLADRARFAPGDWMNKVNERFNLVVTNPPYVASAELDRLEPEVSCYEPRLALDGGADGLRSYHAIAGGLDRVLAEDGLAAFELGAWQAEAVARILAKAGFRERVRRTDLAGIPRCLVVAKKDR
jgi:release factor glutamine methyltransferase